MVLCRAAVTRVSKEHIGQCVREHHDITSESGIAQFVTEHKPEICHDGDHEETSPIVVSWMKVKMFCEILEWETQMRAEVAIAKTQGTTRSVRKLTVIGLENRKLDSQHLQNSVKFCRSTLKVFLPTQRSDSIWRA